MFGEGGVGCAGFEMEDEGLSWRACGCSTRTVVSVHMHTEGYEIFEALWFQTMVPIC